MVPRWLRIAMIPLTLMFVMLIAAPAATGSSLGHISASPSKLSFPKTPVNSVSYLSFWITNDTDIPLRLNNAQIQGRDHIDFTWSPYPTTIDCNDFGPGTPLYPNESCGFAIEFVPIDTGPHKASVWVQFTDEISFFVTTVGLTGTGIEPAP
jgi:hypothetical protein